ncbi:hypothetical protein ACQP0C_09460 [Nocardia sp. CA-129566]|uniref:hypothetical protein n=1 Tax=Nocardia sp. CA-129566 TaxID=3239976 RepID=UPI003D977872
MSESPNLTGQGRVAPGLRFAVELIAWIATPWALAGYSVVLSVLSVLVLIGLPTVFGTPGDKKQTLVAVPGWVTIAMVVLQVVAAVVSAWVLFPIWLAVLVLVLAVLTVIAELPRWRGLWRA